mmetsp:Transcript_25250/g.51536  ORF Transcript_25250/g.51536 Transcript_25250/m.51536 type:complete len:263 (+) Transcript_25250:202-990(+)|eukprot:CAMPEP_0178489930 /NCGR_PEP_ID=MMETSP0696-20121128/10630_1 /TAXON_ID=265572 /ORGANISM="Extubocellulus spinifer, Strain CCMP396" /LENGTH=262 /DNA_ID=CAMNT_0020117747 /DNA_START=30 /DNA_END=818 /DNA_ORIENTATION=+
MADPADPVQPLKNFPGQGGKRFILHRAAGADVLEVLDEHNARGCLEIAADNKSGMLWAKFPGGKGEVAARVDYVGAHGDHPQRQTYFTATACRAYLNYGTWTGMLRRDGDMIGAKDFCGSIMFMGEQRAEVGQKEGVTADDPVFFDPVHSVEWVGDETEPVGDGESDDFRPLGKGCIALTMFFEHTMRGCTVGVPMTMWFRPREGDGDSNDDAGSVSIPSEIVAEIEKIAPRQQDDEDRKRPTETSCEDEEEDQKDTKPKAN